MKNAATMSTYQPANVFHDLSTALANPKSIRQNNQSFYIHHSEFGVPNGGYAGLAQRHASQTKTGRVGGQAQPTVQLPAGRISSMNSTIYPHKNIVMARHGETMNVRDRLVIIFFLFLV